MCIHTKITVIPTPGGAPEDLDEHPNSSLVDAVEWITHTLSTRDGVILLRMWFGEQWGGQKTLIRTIGSTEETLHALRTEFSNAWSTWESRSESRQSRTAHRETSSHRLCNSETAARSPRTHFRKFSDLTVEIGL